MIGKGFLTGALFASTAAAGAVSFDMTVTLDDQAPYPATFTVEDFEDVEAKAELFCQQHNVCDNKEMIVTHTYKLKGTPESALALNEDMVEAMLDPMYWHRFANVNKNLHITADPDTTQDCHTAVVNETRIEDFQKSLKRDGYITLPHLVADELPSLIIPVIKALREHGWPPSFAYVFDELWHLACGLKPLLEPFFGANYRFVPNIKILSGLSTGRDRPHAVGEDNKATSLTFWLPLYDANLDNGAVHVVPKNSDPNYLPPKDDAQTCLPMFTANDFCSSEGSGPSGSSSSLLKSIRALPVDACTYVVWASGLFHWESKPTFASSETDKIQLAFDFEVGTPGPALPTLRDRLKYIGKKLLGEPVGDSIKQVATHLASDDDDASQSSEETEVAEATETDDDTAESI